MKLYDMEFKDELKVTKAEAKQIRYDDIDSLFIIGKNNDNTLYIDKHFNYGVVGLKTIAYYNEEPYFKWVLTNKLKQGDVVKHIDYKIDSKLYVFDSHDTTYNMSNCWYIYKNRPKSWLGDKWMYKLVERE